jgi:hypothetical protein
MHLPGGSNSLAEWAGRFTGASVLPLDLLADQPNDTGSRYTWGACQSNRFTNVLAPPVFANS